MNASDAENDPFNDKVKIDALDEIYGPAVKKFAFSVIRELGKEFGHLKLLSTVYDKDGDYLEFAMHGTLVGGFEVELDLDFFQDEAGGRIYFTEKNHEVKMIEYAELPGYVRAAGVIRFNHSYVTRFFFDAAREVGLLPMRNE